MCYSQFTKGIAALVLGGAFLLCGCNSNENTDGAPTEFLARYGNEYLTMEDVAHSLPVGISPDDSTLFVKSFVTRWVEERLVSRDAASQVDMAEIDRLVDEYRRNLIVTAYRRQLFENGAPAIAEDSIAAYYDDHKTDFILDRPMVKGTYLKVADDARNIRTLKRLYKSDRPDDADRLEKEVLSSAIHYDYFRDKWVDWEQIESKIPEEFGNNPDEWLAKHKTFEKSVGGFTYLLYVTDVLPSGSPMPLENARSQILNRLLNLNRPAFDAAMLNHLYQEATANQTLEIRL